jgi:hypothetical protein
MSLCQSGCADPPIEAKEASIPWIQFWLQPVALARSVGFGAKELGEIARIVRTEQARLQEAWNVILAVSADERVRDVKVSEDSLIVNLMDGRAISGRSPRIRV